MLVPWDYGATGGQLASDEARRIGPNVAKLPDHRRLVSGYTRAVILKCAISEFFQELHDDIRAGRHYDIECSTERLRRLHQVLHVSPVI